MLPNVAKSEMKVVPFQIGNQTLTQRFAPQNAAVSNLTKYQTKMANNSIDRNITQTPSQYF